MPKSYLLALSIILILPIGALAESSEISSPLQKILVEQIEVLATELRQPKILSTIEASNTIHKQITPSQIAELDDRWTNAKGVDDFVKPYLTNDCAKLLVEIQDRHDGFAEVFITNNKGLNVCQTNKTSDLYQADEKWWVDTWNSGSGFRHYGEIEYDQSAHTEAISVYLPVIGSDGRAVIGIAKAVIDITFLKRQL